MRSIPRLKTLLTPSSLRAIASSRSGRALAGTIVGNSAGFILPFLLTARFGSGRDTDAYFYAYSIANYATSVGSSVLMSNVLPVAQGYLKGGQTALQRFLARTTGQAIPILTAIYAVAAAIAAVVVLTRGDWHAGEKATCIEVLALFLPLMAATAATSVYTAGLYASDDFWWATMSQFIGPLVGIAAVSAIPPSRGSLAAVSLGIAVGETARLYLLRVRLRDRVASAPVGQAEPPATSVWRTAGPHALALALTAAAPIIDRSVAAGLPIGSVTLIDLGERIFYVPQLALISSIVLVAGARWSLPSRTNDWLYADYRRVIIRGFVGAVVLGVLALAALLVIGAVEGSRFAGVHTSRLELVTAILLAGLPFGTTTMCGARMLAARRATRVMPPLAVGGFVVNLVADIIGAHWFGVYGIVGSSTLVRFLQAFVNFYVCRRVLDAGAGTLSR